MERIRSSNEKYALEIFSSDAYLPINKQLLKHYGPDVAVFLSNLIDKYKYFKYNDQLKDEKWFYLVHDQQIEHTGLTITKIHSCKAILKRDGIIRTKLQGAPPKEWYELNLTHLLSLIFPTFNGQDSSLLKVRFPDRIYKETKDKEKEKINKKEKSNNTEYLPIAKQLADIILTKKNMNYPPAQISSWTHSIRQLVESNGVDISRVKNALNWYGKNIGGEYVPIIESGDALKKKFLKLEMAIERGNHPKQGELCSCGWKFGVDFRPDIQGCRDCEDDHFKTYERCRITYINSKHD